MRGSCGASEINAPPGMISLVPWMCLQAQGATEHVLGRGNFSVCRSICQVSVFTHLIQVQGEWKHLNGRKRLRSFPPA